LFGRQHGAGYVADSAPYHPSARGSRLLVCGIELRRAWSKSRDHQRHGSHSGRRCLFGQRHQPVLAQSNRVVMTSQVLILSTVAIGARGVASRSTSKRALVQADVGWHVALSNRLL
jgi:hypothetical protein